jgi:hypothetical protein
VGEDVCIGMVISVLLAGGLCGGQLLNCHPHHPFTPYLVALSGPMIKYETGSAARARVCAVLITV